MNFPQVVVLTSLLWLVVERVRDKKSPGVRFAGVAFPLGPRQALRRRSP